MSAWTHTQKLESNQLSLLPTHTNYCRLDREERADFSIILTQAFHVSLSIWNPFSQHHLHHTQCTHIFSNLSCCLIFFLFCPPDVCVDMSLYDMLSFSLCVSSLIFVISHTWSLLFTNKTLNIHVLELFSLFLCPFSQSCFSYWALILHAFSRNSIRHFLAVSSKRTCVDCWEEETHREKRRTPRGTMRTNRDRGREDG